MFVKLFFAIHGGSAAAKAGGLFAIYSCTSVRITKSALRKKGGRSIIKQGRAEF
jgi:hypothetical protein